MYVNICKIVKCGGETEGVCKTDFIAFSMV